jgi:hypothetical protein
MFRSLANSLMRSDIGSFRFFVFSYCLIFHAENMILKVSMILKIVMVRVCSEVMSLHLVHSAAHLQFGRAERVHRRP